MRQAAGGVRVGTYVRGLCVCGGLFLATSDGQAASTTTLASSRGTSARLALGTSTGAGAGTLCGFVDSGVHACMRTASTHPWTCIS